MTALLYALVGVLGVADVALSAVVWSLVRAQDRMMRAMSGPYRAEADAGNKPPAHFSMYKSKVPEGND